MADEQETVEQYSAKSIWVWRSVLIIGALFLAGLSVQRGLGNALESVNPSLAVRIDSGNGSALATLANDKMLAARKSEDVSEIADMSRKALLASPLQVEALRTIGFIEDGNGNSGKARQLLVAASKISKRDALTQAWLFDRYYREGRIDIALEAADIVMRQERNSWDFLVGELLKSLDDPRIVTPMARTLSYRPKWRGTFLESLGRSGEDPKITYQILLKLKALGQPADTVELTPYFRQFHDASAPDLLAKSWSELVPAAKSAGSLRDGGFEGLDAPPPYNWSLYQSDGVYAEFVTNPKGKGRVLYLSYGGNRLANFVNQMLTLKPGAYRLELSAYIEEAIKENQFILYVRCGGVNSAQEIEKIALKAAPEQWATNRLDFKVDSSCPAQQIWISGLPLPGSKDATIWVDDVRLQPL